MCVIERSTTPARTSVSAASLTSSQPTGDPNQIELVGMPWTMAGGFVSVKPRSDSAASTLLASTFFGKYSTLTLGPERTRLLQSEVPGEPGERHRDDQRHAHHAARATLAVRASPLFLSQR